MTNKQMIAIVIYIIIMECWAYGWGYMAATNKQQKINDQLKVEYDELKENYDNLETEYNWRLEACYIQLGDLQDRYELEVKK